MSEEALQACLDRHLEHAAMVFMLDDELGTHHGLSWADFVLLSMIVRTTGLVHCGAHHPFDEGVPPRRLYAVRPGAERMCGGHA